MRRPDMLERLEERHNPWDLVIIGGGATGVGIAVDAASRGYDVLLLEQHDFGKGTSSRSTKLVHGGVRYLEQGNIALVMEALKERGLLRQNAPHLVSNLAFVVPNYDWWEAPFYGLGLKIYNVLAGKYGFGTSEILTREETLARLPTIRTEGLRGGVVYYDGQFDDARLLINLVETAADQGATLVNYVRVVAMKKGTDGFIDGIVAADEESGRQWTIPARVVVNATGAFSDSVRRLAEPDVEALIAPSQGIHLVFDLSFLSSEAAIMVPHTSDGRVMFAIPWHGHCARRHDRHPDRDANARATSAAGGDRLHPRDGRPLPSQATHSRRRPERLCRHPPARQERRRQVDRGAVARPHDSHRCLGAADDDRRQVDDLPEHGGAHRGSGGRSRASGRAAVRHANAQRPRLPLQREPVWRARRLRI